MSTPLRIACLGLGQRLAQGRLHRRDAELALAGDARICCEKPVVRALWR